MQLLPSKTFVSKLIEDLHLRFMHRKAQMRSDLCRTVCIGHCVPTPNLINKKMREIKFKF